MQFENWNEYRDKIFKDIGYEPLPTQRAIHESKALNKAILGGDRSGKSKCASSEATLYIPISKLGWIVADVYDKTKAEFDYCWENCLKMGILKTGKPTETPPWHFETWNGFVMETKATKDPRDLIMKAPDFVVLCESARSEYEAYRRIRGRVAEKRASGVNAPIIMSGSLEGSVGWWPETYTRWLTPNDEGGQSWSMPTWTNTIRFPPGEKTINLVDGRTLTNVNDEIYQLWVEEDPYRFLERYGAVPCKPSGIILPEFSNTIHVGEYPYDPQCPVEIAVDPGYGVPGAYSVLAIQVKQGAIYIVAEKYLQGYTADDVILICQKDWPWFGNISGGAIDIAGKAHPASESQVEIWRKRTGINLTYKYIRVDDGINAIKTFLKVHPETGRPNLFVNYTVKGLIAECGSGRSPVHGGGAWIKNLRTGKPSEDNCHSAKALMYYIINKFGYALSGRPEKIKVTRFY